MEYSTITIIIPTCSRPLQLSNCLESIVLMDYPKERMEVIVVDDGGSPPAADVVRRFEARISVHLILQQNAGPASARNAGAMKAQEGLLAFVDDDCLLTVDWANQMMAFHSQYPEHALGGHTINDLDQNPFSAASQALVDYLYDYYNCKAGQAKFLTSNNVAFPSRLFRAMGGFDTKFKRAAAEDRELCDRWLHHGYPMSYVSGAVVRHSHDLDFFRFWNQHFRYGCGAVDYHKARAMRSGKKVRIEPFRFYSSMFRYPFRLLPVPKALLQSLLFLLAQAANAVGFFWTLLTSPRGMAVAVDVRPDETPLT